MHFQKITKFDTANGQGIRTVLWVSGCNHMCKGCQNPNTWDEHSGKKFTDSDMEELLDSLTPDYIRGVTFSGGDPLYPGNRETVATIAKTIKERYPNKDIWMWTGYLYEEVSSLDLMNYIDVLVDGPFVLEQRDLTLPYCGSPNQRVIDVKKSKKEGHLVLYTK